MMPMSEEAKMVMQSKSDADIISVFNRIPSSLLNREVQSGTHDLQMELAKIVGYYKVYKDGADFLTEGSGLDYLPAKLNYKMAASLIDKEARFLFAEPPDIDVLKSDDYPDDEKYSKAIDDLHRLVANVLKNNKFDQQVVKAARDCFIGKRVGCLVNFNEQDGITVCFIPSTQFIYEFKMNTNELSKFVAFIILKDSTRLNERRIFMKRYTTESVNGEDKVYLDEALYDGTGAELESITEHMEITLGRIPAVVILNDGLTGDLDGESEMESLESYESWFSRLNNADIDAERKGMNPVDYAIDMDGNSTKNLSRAPGSFWDLGSDQNLDNSHAAVGSIEHSLSYSTALSETLKRIKSSAYETVDMPDVTLDSMTGVISSGKALKAVYWPLIVRCKEKMKAWGPALTEMVDIIIKGALEYPNTAREYVGSILMDVPYEIEVDNVLPLPEDEIESKQMDLTEVESNVMSRKSYMKKWRDLTDDEVQEELEQIALEQQIINEASFSTGVPYPDTSDVDEVDENPLGEGEDNPEGGDLSEAPGSIGNQQAK